jgi:hypothetical protein
MFFDILDCVKKNRKYFAVLCFSLPLHFELSGYFKCTL